MSDLDGVFVSLTTGSSTWTGTDDHLYLDVAGTVGGREFALAVDDFDDFDDFEAGTVVPYSIGPGAAVFGGREPDTAADQLERMPVCQPNVTHVSLRKQGDRTHAGDDYWELEAVVVYLVAAGEPTRVFVSTGTARLGNEYGNRVYLAEVGHGGSYLDARIPREGVADCESRE